MTRPGAPGASNAADLHRDAGRIHSAAASDGWKPRFRLAGQTDLHSRAFRLPKIGQLVRRGETATGTHVCTKPWQLYDNGLSFEAFERGVKVADGSLRP